MPCLSIASPVQQRRGASKSKAALHFDCMQWVAQPMLVLLMLTMTVAPLVPPVSASRSLTQSAVTDVDILNFALNLEYLQANYYSCGAYGVPISSTLGGPAPLGCIKGDYSAEVQGLYENLAVNEIHHVAYIQAALGSAAVPQPLINMSALAPAADLALSRVLSPPFSYAASDAPGLVTIFFFEDVAVTAYNGAIPLLTSKAIADTATAVALIEAYHAGIIRNIGYTMRDQLDPYGIELGFAFNAVSALRGQVSASADAANNNADQGITINGAEHLVPADSNGLALSRSPAEILALVFLGSPDTPGGFFPNGLNGVVGSFSSSGGSSPSPAGSSTPCPCSLPAGYDPTQANLSVAIQATGNCPSQVTADCPAGNNYGYNNTGGCYNVGCNNYGTGNVGNGNVGSGNKGDYNVGSNNVGRFNSGTDNQGNCLEGSGLTGTGACPPGTSP